MSQWADTVEMGGANTQWADTFGNGRGEYKVGGYSVSGRGEYTMGGYRGSGRGEDTAALHVAGEQSSAVRFSPAVSRPRVHSVTGEKEDDT